MFCTSEEASLCLELAGEMRAAETLQAYLDVYTHHYLQANVYTHHYLQANVYTHHYLEAKHQLPPDLQGPAHERWQGLKKS